MRNKIVVIYNPLSRGGKNEPLQMPWNGESADDVITEKTSEPRVATKIASYAQSQGARCIVAAGGDGTIHAVLRGLGVNNTSPLGIMPVGTMNVFARELGLPADIRTCWEIILAGKVKSVDAGRANDRLFLSNAGVGLDAQVVAETDPGLRRQLGPISYVIKGLEIAGRPASQLSVLVDSSTPIPATFVMLGNGRFYGGPFELFPQGNLHDGLLDVLLFQRMSHWDVLRYLHGIISGSPEQLEDVHRYRVSRLEVQCPLEEIPWECDGEVCGRTPVVFQSLPSAVNVICPE